MKYVFILPFLLLSTGIIYSQNEQDALRMSRPDYLGTARFIGMGGAMGALGGDASVMSTNPGGLAIFRRSELSLSPGYLINSSVSDFGGDPTASGKNNLALSNLTYVINGDINANSGILGITGAFGYNRTANHFNRQVHRDENPNSSLLDPLQDRLDDSGDPFAPEFAYDVTPTYEAWLLDRFQNDEQYFHANELHEGVQEKEVTRMGSNADYTGALSVNLNNRFFVGISGVISRFRYTENSVYREDEFPSDAEFTDLREWEFEEELDIRGTALMAKIGGVYKGNDMIRLGAAWHTPSRLVLKETFETEVYALFAPEDNNGELEEYTIQVPEPEDEDDNNYSYRLRRPGRAILSAGFILGKRGLISVEYEYANYTGMEFSESDGGSSSFSETNEGMNQILQSTHNLRAGGELRFDNYFLRGGFRFDQNPYIEEEAQTSEETLTYSFGAGYREAKFYFDIAWRWRRMTGQNAFVYDPLYVSTAGVKQNSHAVVLTGGWRW